MAKHTTKQAQRDLRAEKAKASNTGVVPYGQHKKASTFKSTQDQAVSFPRFDEQQQGNLNDIDQRIKQSLQKLSLPGQPYNQLQNAQANAYRDFKQHIVPTIAQRFQSLGDHSGSSSLNRKLSNAGELLQSQIAEMQERYGLQQQQMQNQNFFGLSQLGLEPRYDIGTVGGEDSTARSFWNKLKGGVGGAASGYLIGGPAGAVTGGVSGLLGSSNNNQQGGQLNFNAGGRYNQMQDFGTGNAYQNYLDASQDRYNNAYGFGNNRP